MRFEDLPNLPLDTVGIEKLRESARAAVTQLELAPVSAGTVASCTALAAFFTGLATKVNAVKTAKTPV